MEWVWTLAGMEWVWILAGIALFVVAIFCVALREKHQVRSYSPGEVIDESEFGSYLAQRYAEMLELGIVDLSVHRHLRFKLIVVCGFTSDRAILIHTGEGKLAGMRAKQSWLYSQLSAGEVLVTTDNFDEGDPSGLTKSKRVINARLPKLLSVHRDRLARADDDVVAFSSQEGPEALEDIGRSRAERLVDQGRAQWLDGEQTTWRYTLKGGLSIVGQFFRQLGTGLLQFWRAR